MIEITDDLKEALEKVGIRVVKTSTEIFDWGSMKYAIQTREAKSIDEIVKWYTHSAIEVKTVVLHKAFRSVYKDCLLDDYVSKVIYSAKPMVD
ncbi:hypothetical protein NCTGTJJY_CDS0128 [Serratia phage 92A1]|nr:hypothetical protein NCTGTJJY_CDS0128 [Serratia phage 92A1]